MSDLIIRAMPPRDARWSYDDPSGVPEAPLEVSLPAAAPRRRRDARPPARGSAPSVADPTLVIRSLAPAATRKAA